ERGQGSGYETVSLAESADLYAEPLRRGLTTPGGSLGGGLPGYGLYQTQDGWIAVAALEPHFLQRLMAELGITQMSHDAFAVAFAENTAAFWEKWAAEKDIPLVKVQETNDDYGEEQAKRGSREKMLAVLDKAPDVEPEEYDKL
ncbi:MAG: CoA transferase, partial [Candidatus Promineifilaceae bacterium]